MYSALRKPAVWLSAAACLGVVPASGAAQALPARSSTAPPLPSTTRAATITMTTHNPCAQDNAEFMRLAQVPEGLALLRMRGELEAAERLETVRRESAPSTAPRIAYMRREVDSLTRIMIDVAPAEPLMRRAYTAAEAEARQTVALRVRELAPQVDRVLDLVLARATSGLPPAPPGYFGVTLSSVPLRQAMHAGYIVSYCDYPVVEAVDPGSPAERAGLLAGDTILAFNGRDVRAGMVDYTALLVPDAMVRVRFRRAGRATDAAVRIQPRPDAVPVRVYARATTEPVLATPSRNTFVFQNTSPAKAPPAAVPPPPTTVAFTTDSVIVRMLGRPDMVSMRSVSPVAAPGSAAPAAPVMMSFFANTDDAMVGGAQLKSLSAELRSALTLPEGVLVLQVLRGTPAADGGLREGDVIRQANGMTVRRVADIRFAFEGAGEARSLSFRVVRRDGPERVVLMKW